MVHDAVLYDPETLIRFATDSLQAMQIAENDAKVTSRSLVQADQRGIHSHGLLRLPFYVEAIRRGGINPSPRMKWLRDAGPIGLLDADGALGQVAMAEAVRFALERSATHGVAVVSVQGSTHYGAGAYWTDQLAASGQFAVLTSTTGPVVAPYGGRQKIFGTNPLTMAAPTTVPPALTADLATSSGAYGKIMAARNDNLPIPEGWAVDEHGQPTTDAAAAMAGALIPFGGHKGSAIAALLEAFAAGLGDAAYSHDTRSIWNHPDVRMNTGHLLISIDAGAFAEPERTRAKVDRLQQKIRQSGADGSRVLAPGDIENETETVQSSGIALPQSIVAALTELGADLDVPLPAALPV